MSSKYRYKQDDLEKDAHDMHGAFVWIIILLGVGFSDVIYFMMVSTMFPNAGMMQGIAFAGAITTALSVLLLYHGKKKIFRPGKQVWTAWAFTGVEIGVMISNDILYFAKMNGGSLDAFMAFWKVACPAAPVLSVLGWLLISYFDPSRALLHVKMSKADSLAKAETNMHAEIEQSEIDFKLAMHRSRMDAKYSALEDMQRHLAKAIQYEVQEDLRIGAGDMGRDIASSLTNTPISQLSQSKKPRVVDADPPRSLAPAKAAHSVQKVDPHEVKPEVDNEKKPLEEKKGVRAWIDRNVFKTEEDGRNGELVPPVQYDQDESSRVWKKKDGKWAEAGQQEGEKIKVKDDKPKLPADPRKWKDRHWKIAKEVYPEDEYTELFDEYLGDQPSENQVREDHEDPKQTRRLDENEDPSLRIIQQQKDLRRIQQNENPQ